MAVLPAGRQYHYMAAIHVSNNSVWLLYRSAVHVMAADDASKIPLLFSYWHLLVGHGVVAIYIVVSNVHRCEFANIKFHLPFVGPIFQLVDVFLRLYYVVRVPCFAAELGIISEFGYFADNVVIQVIYLYEEQ